MQIQSTETSTRQDDWTLNTEQMIFMLQHHNLLEADYATENLEAVRALANKKSVDEMVVALLLIQEGQENIEALRTLADSEAYKALFGEMSIDEAIDRYECMLE